VSIDVYLMVCLRDGNGVTLANKIMIFHNTCSIIIGEVTPKN